LLSFGRLTDSCSLIGLRDRPAGKRLVFRIQGRGECLTYLEFAYARANDRVCLVDGYSHPLGERLSDSARIDPPTGNIRLEMENLKKRKVLREKMTAARSGDAQEFVKLYRE